MDIVNITDLPRAGRNREGGSHALTPMLHPVEAAAARLGIGRTLIYELLSTGELPSVQIRGRRLVAESDLVAYVRGLRRSAP